MAAGGLLRQQVGAMLLGMVDVSTGDWGGARAAVAAVQGALEG